MRDYHVHSYHSIDGRGAMAAYCASALANGVTEIVFTEHFDLNPAEGGTGFFDYARYCLEIENCRRSFGERLTILKGLELGEPHLYQKELGRLARQDFDFCLGSVHWLGDEALHLGYCEVREEKDAYAAYFAEVWRAVAAGGFDVLGHLDLLKRYAPAGYSRFDPIAYAGPIRDILRAAVEAGIGLEVNTSGWRQGLGEPLPGQQILAWYRELGGELITVGSDAHRVEDLGRDVGRAYQLLRELGFPALTVYRGRRPRQLDWAAVEKP